MENEEEMPNLLERKRLKDRVVDSISRAVKQLQQFELGKTEPEAILTNSDWRFQRLAEHLDHAFLHGLRHITNGYWVVVQEFTHHSTVKEIQQLDRVTTHLGRGRAWLYTALNDQLLESYLLCVRDHRQHLNKYYAQDALLLDEQRLEILVMLAAGLELVTFQLDANVPYLDLASHMRPVEPRPEDTEDSISLSSMDSSVSQGSGERGIGELGQRSAGLGQRSNSMVHQWMNSSEEELMHRRSKFKSSASMPILENGQCDVRSEENDGSEQADTVLHSTPAAATDATDAESGEASEPVALEVIHMKAKSQRSRRKKVSKRRPDSDTDGTSLNSFCQDADAVSITSGCSYLANPQTPESGYRSVAENSSPSHKTCICPDGNSTLAEPRQVTKCVPMNGECGHSPRSEASTICAFDTASVKSEAGHCCTVEHKTGAKMDDTLEEDATVSGVTETKNEMSDSGIENNETAKIESNTTCHAECGTLEPTLTWMVNMTQSFTADDHQCLCSHYEKEVSPTDKCNSIKRARESEPCIEVKHLCCTCDNSGDKEACVCVPPAGSGVSADIPIPDLVDEENGLLENSCDSSQTVTASLCSESSIYDDSPTTHQLNSELNGGLLQTEIVNGFSEPKQGDVSPSRKFDKGQTGDYSEAEFLDGCDVCVEAGDDRSVLGQLRQEDILKLNHKEVIHEAEIKVDNNLKLVLMLEVFEAEDEQLIRMFSSCVGHTEGAVLPVYVVLTNLALYLLVTGRRRNRFTRHTTVPYHHLDYISLSINYQVIHIVCTNRRRQYWLTTADQQLTRCILVHLDAAVRRSQRDLPRLTVLTDATTQRLAMCKWLAQESNLLPQQVKVLHYTLVHWESMEPPTSPASASVPAFSNHREGALLYRSTPGLFGFGTAHWLHAYFVLREGCLYQYADRYDSGPAALSIPLNTENCGGCRRCRHHDQANCFEVVLSSGSSLQLAASSEAEVQKWLQSLCQSVAQGSRGMPVCGGCLPCCCVITDQSIYMCHEDLQTNFIRTLGTAPLSAVTRVITDPAALTYIVLVLQGDGVTMPTTGVDEAGGQHWVVYFTTGAECESFMTALHRIWALSNKGELPVHAEENLPVHKHCRAGITKLKKKYTI